MGYACKLSGEYDNNLIEAYSIGGNIDAHRVANGRFFIPRCPDAIVYCVTSGVSASWRYPVVHMLLKDNIGTKINYSDKAISNSDVSYTYDNDSHMLNFSSSPSDSALLICLFNKKVKNAQWYTINGYINTTKVITVPSEPYAVYGFGINSGYMRAFMVYKDNKGNRYNISPYCNATKPGFNVDYTYNKETKELTVSGTNSEATAVGYGIFY